jgi:hypothetical protein
MEILTPFSERHTARGWDLKSGVAVGTFGNGGSAQVGWKGRNLYGLPDLIGSYLI